MITEEQFNQLLERVTKIEEALQKLHLDNETILDRLDDIESNIEDFDFSSPEDYEAERLEMEEKQRMEEELINTPIVASGTEKIIPDNKYDSVKCAKLILKEGIEEIGWQGVARCDNITELIIPASVRKIGYLFCCHCRRLNKVKFLGPCPSGLERAFENCPSLKEIQVPASFEKEYRQALKKDVVCFL